MRKGGIEAMDLGCLPIGPAYTYGAKFLQLDEDTVSFFETGPQDGESMAFKGKLAKGRYNLPRPHCTLRPSHSLST